MSEPKKDLHVCMGLNSCKNLGYTGKNDCAGMGDCATAVGHPCHTLNSCKGQGGCGIFGTTEEFCHPGLNDCKYQGSCGVPILNSRFIAQGPNKGRSVWVLARARFEEQREAENKPYGMAPLPYGPTSEFVSKIKGDWVILIRRSYASVTAHKNLAACNADDRRRVENKREII